MLSSLDERYFYIELNGSGQVFQNAQIVKHNSAKRKINLIKIPVLIKCKHSNITAWFITNQAVQMHMHSRGGKHR